MPEEKNQNNNIDENKEYSYKMREAPALRPVAALVLGIASVVLCVLPFMLIAAVVGLLLEKESERTGYHKLQKPARILCIIGIVLCSAAIAAILTVLFVLRVISG